MWGPGGEPVFDAHELWFVLVNHDTQHTAGEGRPSGRSYVS